MPVKPEDVELGKSYQMPNGMVRKVFEIVPDGVRRTRDDVSDKDIIRYEAEKWGYDENRHGGKTRVKQKIREKMKRCDFAKEASKRLD
jgi:hypothetical protein